MPCAAYVVAEASQVVCQYLSNDSCPRSYEYVNEREISVIYWVYGTLCGVCVLHNYAKRTSEKTSYVNLNPEKETEKSAMWQPPFGVIKPFSKP